MTTAIVRRPLDLNPPATQAEALFHFTLTRGQYLPKANVNGTYYGEGTEPGGWVRDLLNLDRDLKKA